MSRDESHKSRTGLDDLDRLLESLFDGGLSDDQWNDLCSRMTADADARRRYIQFVQLHGLLQTRYSLDRNPVLPEGANDPIRGDEARVLQELARQQFAQDHAKALVPPALPRRLSPMPRPEKARESFFTGSRFSAWRIAAIFIFIASAVFMLTSPTWTGWWRSTPVATLADAVDAQWDAPQSRLDVGDHLPYGSLFLKSGYANIRLDNGVKLVVVGPAHFSVDSLKLAHLDEGKLTVDVPHAVAAAGFSVKIPSGMVTDLGTTFGVTAFLNRESTVQVIKGSVQAKLFSEDGSQKDQVLLTENHAVAFSPISGTVTSIPVDPDNYVTNIRQIRVPLALHNTGQGLSLGEADPYWQITARSDESNWTVRPATVTLANQAGVNTRLGRTANDRDRSQWLCTAKAQSNFPGGCRLTFTTTIDLIGFDAMTASLRMNLMADNYVREVRLNGRPTGLDTSEVKDQGFQMYRLDRGFVNGKNVLEFVVENGFGLGPPRTPNPMGFRAELDGTAVRRGVH